jgi:hypothetical protein
MSLETDYVANSKDQIAETKTDISFDTGELTTRHSKTTQIIHLQKT